MPLISPTLPNNGETADAPDVNIPFNAILSLLNGGLDSDNFDSEAVFEVVAVKTDDIDEQSANHGVEIDGVLLKDGFIGPGVLPPTYIYFQGAEIATSGASYTSQRQTRVSINFDVVLRGATAAYLVTTASAADNANTDQSTAKLQITNGAGTHSGEVTTDVTGASATGTSSDRLSATSADILANLPSGTNLMQISTRCGGTGMHSGVGTIAGTHLRIDH